MPLPPSFAFLLVLGALAVCAPDAPSPDATVPAPSTVTAAQHGDTLIVLTRTGCYGRCPAYEVAVQGDGSLVFTGHADVAHLGEARASVSPDTVAHLVTAFEEARHASLPEDLSWGSPNCTASATDRPSATTALAFGSDTTRVHHNHGCVGFDGKEALTALEDEIDRALGTARWVRG